MNTIYDTIRTYKTEINDSTTKNYAMNLSKLLTKMDSINILDIVDKSKVDEVLKTLNYKTIRNYYNAIIVYLKAVNHDDFFTKIIDEYIKHRDEYNNQYKEWSLKNEKSEKQEENWITEKELDFVLEYQKQFDLQKYLMLRLYMLYPVRNDLRNLQIITLGKFLKIPTEWKLNNNYFIRCQKPIAYKIALNNYKTSKTYGEIVIDVDSSLNSLIGRYLRKTQNTSYLFTKPTGGSMSSNEFTKFFQSCFKPINKNIGSTMFRHLIASFRGADNLKQQKELAKNMGHSIGMNNDYIKID
jgi:hypothetical protein